MNTFRPMLYIQRQMSIYIKICLRDLCGKPRRSAGPQDNEGMLLATSTTVDQELETSSIYTFSLLMSKVQPQKLIYALWMGIGMPHTEKHVLLWGSWKMMVNGTSVLMRHVQSSWSIHQSANSLQSSLHTTIPEALWEEFKHIMCDDLLLWHQFPLNPLSTDDEVLDYGLFLIQ